MPDIRDSKRQVPMSEDMLYSRMVAVAILVAIPIVVWLLSEAWWYVNGWVWAR